MEGNAVAAWVSSVDEAAVRNTQDVDILIRRKDFEAATEALTGAGFVRRRVRGIEMFLDGPDAKARDAVHIVFAGEKILPDYVTPAPDVSESNKAEPFAYINLEPLVRMKLTSFRLRDQVHLIDLIDIGLVDTTWPGRFPSELGSRLQHLLDNPEG